VSLLVAAFASELSLAAAAMIASFELLATERAPRARLLRSAAWLVAALGYLLLYSAFGYGTRHSGLYLSPFAQPGQFLLEAATRLPILLGELAFAVPSFLWGAAEPARPVLAVLGAATAALVVALAFRAATTAPERRRTTWFAVAALLGARPVVGGVPDGRVLLLALLASAPLVATAIEAAFGAAGRPASLLLRACGVVLLFQHVVFAALVRVGMTELIVSSAAKSRALAENMDASRCSAGSPAYVVTGADPALCLAFGPSLLLYRPDLVRRHPRLAMLSLAPHDLRMERKSDKELVLEVVGSPRRVTIFERLFRDTPLAAGQRVVLEDFAARVLAVEGDFATRVAFELPENTCLLTLERQMLVGRPMPPVGSARDVPHELGPMGL
jgi:hypothetical protein